MTKRGSIYGKDAGRVGIFGASGSGKTVYVKKQIANRSRMIIFDPQDEYGDVAQVRTESIDHVRELMAQKWPNFSIRFVPKAGKEPKQLSKLCRLLIAAQDPMRQRSMNKPFVGQGIILVVDELNLCFPVHSGHTKCAGFAEVCSRGRHYGIHVYGLSQRIAEVATRFRGNCSEMVILRQQGKTDLKTAADTIGADQKEVATLKNLDYLTERQGVRSKGRIRL